MSQFLSQIPRMALQQQQRLTPQQIQSLNILQLNVLSLEARIEMELDDNPALERIAGDESGVESEAPSVEDDTSDIREQDLVISETDNAKDFERLDSLVSEYGWDDDFEYRGTHSRAALAEQGDAKLEAMANTPSRPVSIQETLLGQWALVDVDDDAQRIGEHIINSVGDSGRLETPLEAIQAEIEFEASAERMADVLARVQQLDPPGVAARSLRECLLLQIDALPGDNSIERRIIAEQLENLEKNRLPAIASALRIELEELKAAVQVIARLSLHPGEELGDRGAPGIVPDVIVEYNEDTDGYDVRLTRGSARELRISPEFREALQNSRADKKTREFLKEKLDAAKSIIDAVRFRRDRLLDVARSVVKVQRAFLKEGEQHLKVLRMSDLAVELGCDPSTISRTVDEKYIDTPRGIFPLRRFFTGGAESGDGEALGWDSIKAKVREIVANEDKSKPLNDDKIVRMLAEQNIHIKRRTVAKYRQQLDIPTSRQRREY